MATTTVKTETFVGKRVRRREDPRLITGTATYVEDIQMPGMHYAVICGVRMRRRAFGRLIQSRRRRRRASCAFLPERTRKVWARSPAGL